MKIGSLFSGIGGLEKGLEDAGVGRTVWQVEIDPFCRQVLEKHWPDVRRYEDVKEVGPGIEPVNVICGGFPCQDISNAGKRAGIQGERSGLWSEFQRIISVVRPSFVVVENVSALLGRGMGVVLGDLAALGYDAEWDCIPASAIGAPHQRDRLFIIAWRISDAGGEQTGQSGRVRGKGGSGSPEPLQLGERYLADYDGNGCNRDGGQGQEGDIRETQSWIGSRCGKTAMAHPPQQSQREPDHKAVTVAWQRAREGVGGRSMFPPGPGDLQAWRRMPTDLIPSFCRRAPGIPKGLVRDRAKQLSAYGNAVVPQVAEVVGRRLLEISRRTDNAVG